ncbi:MAG: accessory regulator AgrB [Clostridia bacterium]|nr:accessory regulator AgrB [Clostridia bacterium]
MIRYSSEKLCEKMLDRGLIQKEDAELYRYGMEQGVIVAGNLLTAVLIGILTERLGVVLVFLFFYVVLRSYSGGKHVESKLLCYLISNLILLIPIYTYEWVFHAIPLPALMAIGVFAVVIVFVLCPVESENKRLDDDEYEHYKGISQFIVGLEGCVLVGLYCLGAYRYFYAGYISILLVAIFMVVGRLTTKHYR